MKHLLNINFDSVKFLARARTPEHIDHGIEAPTDPTEGGIDTVDDAAMAEEKAEAAGEYGDAAVAAAKERFGQISSTGHRSSVTESVSTSDGTGSVSVDVTQRRLMEDRLKVTKAEKGRTREVAGELAREQAALETAEEDPEPDNPPELQSELDEIDGETVTSEKNVEEKANTQTAAVQTQANEWLSGVTEVGPDRIMTSG